MAEGQGRSSGQGLKLLYLRDYLCKYTNKEHPKSAKEIITHLASKGILSFHKDCYITVLSPPHSGKSALSRNELSKKFRIMHS